jgi:Ras family protein
MYVYVYVFGMYEKTAYSCDILDTAGQDEYSSITRNSAIGAHGYVLAFSVTDRSSFNLIDTIYRKLIDLVGSNTAPCVVVGCKNDADCRR